jgi:hypothetical protein
MKCPLPDVLESLQRSAAEEQERQDAEYATDDLSQNDEAGEEDGIAPSLPYISVKTLFCWL